MSDDTLRRLADYRQQFRDQTANQYRSQSRDQLKKHITTKLRTTMIGSVAAVEEALGWLWNHGRPRTDIEAHHWDLWQDLRTRLLNLGNSQIRAALQELDQYEVSWNRYSFHQNFKGK